MDPIALDVRLIKAVLGSELRIAPGRALVARVVNTDGLGRGVITIAGEPLEASLPEHIQPGQELRLVVRDVSADRVVLGLADPGANPQATAIPLPGGGTIRVSEESSSGGGAGAAPGTHTLAIRYDAPALGPVDLRFELAPGSLRVGVAVVPGRPHEDAQARASELQQSLEGAVARAVSVHVEPRHEPLDLYA
jgi:hypothetical protein